MKRALVLLVLLVGALTARHYIAREGADTFSAVTALESSGSAPGTAATREPAPPHSIDDGGWHSGQMVEGEGLVTRLLSDDRDGNPHQRFILRLPSGRTLLVAHNISLAPRVDALRVGDRISFRGEYEPNAQGGVLHWTHHDPQGAHPGGWLRHHGRTYQ